MPASRRHPTPSLSKAQQRLQHNILEALRSRQETTITVEELEKLLRVPPKQHDLFESIIGELLLTGTLYVEGQAIGLRKTAQQPHSKQPAQRKETRLPREISGILRKHPRGFGFVAPQDCPQIQEVFIPKMHTGGAMDGDLVQVEIDVSSAHHPKGPEGRISRILERTRDHLIGYVREYNTVWVRGLEQNDGLLPIAAGDVAATAGDRVLCQMVRWPDDETGEEGEVSIVRNLGSIEDPAQDVPVAMEEFQLRAEFPEAALEEALTWGGRVRPKDLIEREDLRHVECFTIDPKTAKDFDDALSLVKTRSGHYQLGVHIADVAHYVLPGSALDREARRRCNSTYFPGRCIPMLPHELSDNLCSLKEGVNRLTVTVFMEFDPSGEMVRYRIVRSVIRSAKRFTYEEALEVLEKKRKSKHSSTLEKMVELCNLLKAKRAERGSVELALSDVQVLVDENGVPTGFERHEYDITHQMVEEFMLKANEVVAAHLTKRKMPVAYRIHAPPSTEALREFTLTARALGFRLPQPPSQADLQQLFIQAGSSPLSEQLAVAFVKSMNLAYYSPDNIGHYGLGLTHYCHFTSPIRRYSDLIAQRALFNIPEADLSMLTEACSEQERRSARAEESVVLLKKLRLLKKMLDDGLSRTFEATITRVRSSGIVFEIPSLMVEGFLHVRNLGHEYFYFDPHRLCFTGEFSGTTFGCGAQLHVELEHLDLIRLETSWVIASLPNRSSSGQHRKRKKKKRSEDS